MKISAREILYSVPRKTRALIISLISRMVTTVTSLSDRLCPPGSWQEPDSHFLEVLRSPWYRDVSFLIDLFHTATVEFWKQTGGRAAYLPVTTGSVSSPMGRGSDSTPVNVRLAGVDTYLADSMQFPLELTCRVADGPSYYVMPSFRGEDADETHLCQFFHSEAELPGGLDDVIVMVEAYVRHLSKAFLTQAGDVVQRLAGGTDHLQAPLRGNVFRRLEFDQAVDMLGNEQRYVHEEFPGCRSLTREGEHRLMELVGQFVWVTHMDHLSVPFYQAFDPTDKTKALCADLLFGIGETVGCGERHADAGTVREALALHEVNEDDYAWYVRMREAVPMQTAGFGMGVERFLLWVTNHNDIRDLPTLLRFNGRNVNP
ncbi:amino acid--tRNA ligase-related protein [Streptomyces sp. IBSNAI002]|uniref:amino acid--tRNA ligase-related protein n=1 Tax=Streptomyces sp. IBSNAI002 TaxID=3457500 RepID=UPI003FD4DD6F